MQVAPILFRSLMIAIHIDVDKDLDVVEGYSCNLPNDIFRMFLIRNEYDQQSESCKLIAIHAYGKDRRTK